MSGQGDGWGFDDDDVDATPKGDPIPTGNPYATGEYAAPPDVAPDTADPWPDEADGDFDGGGAGAAARYEDGSAAAGPDDDVEYVDDQEDAEYDVEYDERVEYVDDQDDAEYDAEYDETVDDHLDADAGHAATADAGDGLPRPLPAADPDDWAADAEAGLDDLPPELLGSTSLPEVLPPPPPRRSNRFTRLLVLLVLIGMLAAGVALERREPQTSSTRVTTPGVDGPEVPAAGAVSTAWYCAAGTSGPDGAADETIHVANLSADPITAEVTVDPGGDDTPQTARLRIAPYARESLPVSEVLTSDTPGVVVEVRGGVAIVEHEIRNGDDLAMSPCADEPSRTWYFAAGGTADGADQTLELFNPYGDDAVVDIAFLTEGGEQEPQALQGLVIGRRSKVRVTVGDLVARQERVATVVRTRAGRVIAEQVRTVTTGEGTELALSLGTSAPRRDWTLPVAAAETGAAGTIAIANFSLTPTTVEVSLQLSGDGVLSPETIEVPSRSVVWFDTTGRIPAGTAWTAVVQAQGPARVVAESVWTPSSGAATSGGAAVPHLRWALAGAPERASSAVLATNRGAAPITVELRAFLPGDVDGPTSAPAIALAPGKTARFDLDEWGIDPEQVLVVSADGPIVVGRETYTGGASLALAVPFPG